MKNPGTKSIVRIASAIVPVIVLLLWFLMQANFLMGRALNVAYPGIEVVYSGAMFDWDGDVSVRDVVIMPSDTDDESAIRFERAHVEVPGGWFWYLRNLFDRRLKRASMSRVHLTLDGGRSEGGIEPTLGNLGPFGATSASPFEAEGCASDSSWVREELKEMGLQPEATRLEFDYAIDGSALNTTIVLETPRASRVKYERREILGGSGNALLIDSTPTKVQSERWEVQDQGFVAARNRFCGRKDGIDARRFLDRHIEAIERLQAMAGVAWGPDARTAYKRFARDGGTLVFEGQYSQPVEHDEWVALYDSGEVLHRLHANLSHNGRGLPVAWQRIAPRPLPGYEDGEPTYALLVQERRGVPAPAEDVDVAAITAAALAAETSAAAAAAPASGAPQADDGAGPAATTATAPDAEAPAAAVAAPPQSPPEENSAAPTTAAAASSAAPAATPDVPAPAPAPAPAAATPPPAAPATATPATPTPLPHLTAAGVPPLSAEAQARIKVRSDAAPVAPSDGLRPGQALEWLQLASLRGRMVRIWTMHNPPRTVEILSGGGNELRVATRVGGGNAEYTVQREGFLRASLVR